MLAKQALAADQAQAIAAQSLGAGDTNGSYIDASDYEGDLLFACDVGALTGDVTFKVQDADDGAGTGVADVAGAVTSTINTGNTQAKIIVPAGAVRPFVRVVATVTTGPVLGSVQLLAHPKYTV